MTQDIRAVVVSALDAVAGVLNRPDMARTLMAGQDLAFDVVEIDSLSLLELVMQIEDALGVELDADEVAAQGSINGLVRFLQPRVAAG
jgi:acyl carrier protein